MYLKTALCAASALALTVGTQAFADGHASTITIATVNNGDMIRMQGYTDTSVMGRITVKGFRQAKNSGEHFFLHRV